MSFRSLRQLLDGVYDTVDAAEDLSRALGRLRMGRIDLPIVGERPPAPAALPLLTAGPGEVKARVAEVRTIDDRVAHIIRFAQAGRQHPQVREFAIKSVSKRCGDKWCVSEEDNWKECQALFAALKQRFRYTGDVFGMDTYQHPEFTLRAGGADCDDASSLVGATFGAIGYTVYLRVIETVDSPLQDWDHIYNMVGLPRDAPTSVVPIDLAAINKPAGWQVPDNHIKRKKDWLIP